MRQSIDSVVEFSVWNETSGYLFKGSPEFEHTLNLITDTSMAMLLYTLCEVLDEIQKKAMRNDHTV